MRKDPDFWSPIHSNATLILESLLDSSLFCLGCHSFLFGVGAIICELLKTVFDLINAPFASCFQLCLDPNECQQHSKKDFPTIVNFYKLL